MACLAIHPPSLGKCTMVKIVFSRMYHHKKLVASISCFFDLRHWMSHKRGAVAAGLLTLNPWVCLKIYWCCLIIPFVIRFMFHVGISWYLWVTFILRPSHILCGCVYTQIAAFSLGSSWWSSMKLSFSMGLPSFSLYFQTTCLFYFHRRITLW